MFQLFPLFNSCGFSICFLASRIFKRWAYAPNRCGNRSRILFTEMCSVCFWVLSSVSALVLTFIVSGFLEHSSLGLHDVQGTTPLSSVARASEISMRSSVSAEETSKIQFSGELLAIWSFRCPKLQSPPVFVFRKSGRLFFGLDRIRSFSLLDF